MESDWKNWQRGIPKNWSLIKKKKRHSLDVIYILQKIDFLFINIKGKSLELNVVPDKRTGYLLLWSRRKPGLQFRGFTRKRKKPLATYTTPNHLTDWESPRGKSEYNWNWWEVYTLVQTPS